MLTTSILLYFMAGFLINGELFSQVKENMTTNKTLRPSEQRAIETCFPLERGNYWVYHGTYQTQDASGIITDTLTWKAEVKEVIDLDEVKLYVIKGFPFLLHSYTFGSAEKENSILNTDYVMIQVGSNRFYQYGYMNKQDLNEIKNSDQYKVIIALYSSGVIDENSVFLYLPLTVGKEFSDWQVSDSSNVTLEDVKGIPHSDTYTVYTIEAQNSWSQSISFDFIPFIGITGFYYNGRGHAGSVGIVEVSVGRGKQSQK